jgi:hypothetical protein
MILTRQKEILANNFLDSVWVLSILLTALDSNTPSGATSHSWTSDSLALV